MIVFLPGWDSSCQNRGTTRHSADCSSDLRTIGVGSHPNWQMYHHQTRYHAVLLLCFKDDFMQKSWRKKLCSCYNSILFYCMLSTLYFKMVLKESLRNCCCGPYSPWPWSMGPQTSPWLCPVDSYLSCLSWLWGVPKWPTWYLYPREASVPPSLTWFSTAPVTTYLTW